MVRAKIAAGNWKMNGLGASVSELDAVITGAQGSAEVVICPPATLLARFADRARGSRVRIGAQDCHAKVSGAHTGDVAAEMVADAGGTHVIVGHSERRADHGEDDAAVRAKAEAAWRAGLVAIICVGETESQRDSGDTLGIVGQQLRGSVPEGATADNTVIAYEPVWAIGTGRTPTLDEIAEVHDFIRADLAQRFGTTTADGIRLLYGGSVKPSNASEIFAVSNVDGGLIGGASLKASDFLPVIAAAG